MGTFRIPKTLLIAIGALIGSTGTFIYMKRKYEVMEMELDDLREERESLKAIDLKNYDLDEDDREEVVSQEPFNNRTEAKAEFDHIQEEHKLLVMQRNKYKKVAKKYNNYAEKESPQEDPVEHPYTISEDEFMNNEDNEQITFYYYEEDNVLTEDDEETVVPDVDTVVGKENLGLFGEFAGQDPAVVYVRNELLRSEYEIIRLEKSYSEAVLGYTDDEKNYKSHYKKESDLND